MLLLRIVSFDRLPQALRSVILYAFALLIFHHNPLIIVAHIQEGKQRFRIGKDFAEGHTARIREEKPI